MRIAVGMSGGLDSTMTALLLKDCYSDIVGLSMRIWSGKPFPNDNRSHGCYGPSEESDIADAQAACLKMGIPHHVIDLSKEYSDIILQNFSSEYLHGRTPNPCILCNPIMKFGAMLKKAREHGIGFSHFATGHYVRVSYDERRDRYILKKALDPKKDQSYFLYRLNQNQLAQVIFPLGEFFKKDIKKMAVERGFSDYANKPESQNFMDGGNYRSLIDEEDKQEGNIVDIYGNVIGKHSGIDQFTIGQRKGLNIGGQLKPLYVVDKNAENNTIIVGDKEKLIFHKLTITNLNWVSIERLLHPIRLSAKFRFTQTAVPCRIEPINENAVEVIFEDPQLAATPGQSAVFYQEDEMVGGGIIETVHYNLLQEIK
jgi:tRNA-specific 2-thiouridylase